MKSFLRIILVSLTFLLCFNSSFGQIKNFRSINDLLQNRNLTQYVQKNLTCNFNAPAPVNECQGNKINTFIWNCWTEKIKGYLTVTYVGIDFALTQHIFIEPTRQNQWRVAQRIVRSHTMSKSNNLVEDIPTAFSVEQVKSQNEPDQWKLVFRNKFGKVIKDF